MRKLNLSYLLLIVIMSMSAAGCFPHTHINNVPPERQAEENFIRDTGLSLDSLDSARETAFEAVIKLYIADQVDKETYETAVEADRVFDEAFKAAGESLKAFTKASRKGEPVEKATVETALTDVRSALESLQGVK